MLVPCCLLVFLIGSSSLSKKTWGLKKLFVFGVLLILSFGVIGNFRESIDNNATENYIFQISEATKQGELLGSIFYWFWLYLASPIYNLFYNIKECNSITFDFLDIAASTFLPDFAVNFFGFSPTQPLLIVDYFNVSTGYGAIACGAGVLSSMLYTFIIIIWYKVNTYVLTGNRLIKFNVFFSVCMMLIVFNNVFLRAEFFVVFVFIYIEEFFAILLKKLVLINRSKNIL